MVAGTWCVLWKVFLIASPWLPQPEVVALAQGRLMGSFLEQGMKRSDVEDVLGKKGSSPEFVGEFTAFRPPISLQGKKASGVCCGVVCWCVSLS
jgi:hypothetical protein